HPGICHPGEFLKIGARGKRVKNPRSRARSKGCSAHLWSRMERRCAKTPRDQDAKEDKTVERNARALICSTGVSPVSSEPDTGGTPRLRHIPACSPPWPLGLLASWRDLRAG